MPSRTNMRRSNSGKGRKKFQHCTSEQKPSLGQPKRDCTNCDLTRRMSPAAAREATYRWNHRWMRSQPLGLGKMTTSATWGLVLSWIRLMDSPLPAPRRQDCDIYHSKCHIIKGRDVIEFLPCDNHDCSPGLSVTVFDCIIKREETYPQKRLEIVSSGKIKLEMSTVAGQREYTYY